jgi:anti-sigma factor ChrR (cupin superfamily)
MSGTPDEDKAGGPAFPTDYHSECPTCKTEVYGATSHGGMTLRDYFAAASLPGIQRGVLAMAELGKDIQHLAQAQAAYRLADAMLAARKE